MKERRDKGRGSRRNVRISEEYATAGKGKGRERRREEVEEKN